MSSAKVSFCTVTKRLRFSARPGYYYSMMQLRDERGQLNILLIPVILLVLLLIGAAGFAVWAFNGRQLYKNNVDAKISAAVAANTQSVQATDAKQFAQAAKLPLKTYVGPEAYGSVHISYPKTWSAYVDTTATDPGLNGYFYPDAVPSISSQTSTFALRVEVAQTSYNQVVSQFSGQLQQGTVTVTPYKLPLVPSVVGVRVDGQITATKQGSMVVLPLRDKTLEIWTESNSFLPDFNNNILPNLSFSP